MFLTYYGLREQPFGVTPDPRFLYFGQVHREALASLVYGVEAGLGFTSLIAEPGTGKTTLLYYILGHYRTTARTAFIFDTQCTSRELLRNLLVEFEIDGVNESDPAAWLNQLKEFLAVQARARRRVLVVLDEAQNFDDSVLETIRLLSNFETAGAKLLHIILSGQPQLAEKLSQPALMNVRQRITVATRLRPFAPVDVVKYVAHRLSVGGYQGNNALFTAAALESLARLSGGIPREINRLCFGAMSMGCALDRKIIDADVVKEVANDFDFSSLLSATPAPRNIDLPPAEQLEQVFADALARAQKAGAEAQAPRPPKPAGQVASASVPRPKTSGFVALELSHIAPPAEARAQAMPEAPARTPAPTAADRVAPPSATRRHDIRPVAELHPPAHASAVATLVAPAQSVAPQPAPAVKPATTHPAAVPTPRQPSPRAQRPAPMVPLQSWIARENSHRGPRRPALIAAALALIAAAAIAIQLLPAPAAVAPAQQIVQPADEAPAGPSTPAPQTRNHRSDTSHHNLSRYAASPGASHSTYEQRRTKEAWNPR